jgi:hypothetical protein
MKSIELCWHVRLVCVYSPFAWRASKICWIGSANN